MTCCKLCDQPICARGLCRKHYAQAWNKNEHSDFSSKTMDLKTRLLSKTEILPNGCWEFIGTRRSDKHRYGYIWSNGKRERAHRVSFEIHKGTIPDGMCILHSCDFPPCINPDHLSLGTRGENIRDAVEKRRNARGETHGHSKLTREAVVAIRQSQETQRSLSKQHGVTQHTISRILSGHRWKDI